MLERWVSLSVVQQILYLIAIPAALLLLLQPLLLPTID